MHIHIHTPHSGHGHGHSTYFESLTRKLCKCKRSAFVNAPHSVHSVRLFHFASSVFCPTLPFFSFRFPFPAFGFPSPSPSPSSLGHSTTAIRNSPQPRSPRTLSCAKKNRQPLSADQLAASACTCTAPACALCRLRIIKMSYFILLVECGTKYRTRLIITFPACQVRRRPSHPTPSPCVSTVILAKSDHSNRPPFLYFSNRQFELPADVGHFRIRLLC